MIKEDNFNASDLMGSLNEYITDEKCHRFVEKTLRKYHSVNKTTDSDIVLRVAESLNWMAEASKSPEKVISGARCLLLDDVINTVSKFRYDVADEVMTNICWVVEESSKKDVVTSYVKWLNNGYISGLLDFAGEFNNNGSLKLKKDIFNVLTVNPDSLEDFNRYATIINNKRLNLQKKLEFFVLLRDIVNLKKENYAETLAKYGTGKLLYAVEKDLGDIKIGNTISSLRYGIRLTEDIKTNENIRFLVDKHITHGSIKKWLFKDEITKGVVKELADNGIDPELYVASGKLINQIKSNEKFSDNWMEVLSSLVVKLVGSRKKNLLPEVSVYSFSPRFIFKTISRDYLAASEGDKEAGKRTLAKLRKIIEKAYEGRKITRPVQHVLDTIDSLKKTIAFGCVVDYRGSKVVARVWKRKVPNDFYDSEMLRSCMYLPYGEMKYEIPLFMMDPKTTLVQYYIHGIDTPIAATSFYAGKINGETTLLVDTWDAGGLAYTALGHDKMKEFVLDGIKKFGKIFGTKVAIFSNAYYGRPKEFCNFLRDKGMKIEPVYFEALDIEDKVLKAYSAKEKNHYTDAFDVAPLKGNTKVFFV
ncbi:MAG: hypothetical protein NT120_03200 [Candidatus Aenigmarchaeota archaeon]|nr:hypothetical protein [Candidatus Aenigmarchaeota archaeon]